MEKITYGIHDSPVGEMILGQSDKGLCWLGFMTSKAQGAYKGDGESRMKVFFPHAKFIRDDEGTKDMAAKVLKAWEKDDLKSVPLDLRGTEFQKTVWNALLDIPGGQVCSYGGIAARIGKPKASRAVGTAVGDNPVSLIVPCHRVVRGDGGLGNYGWGIDIKEKLLQAEQAIPLAA